MGEKRVVRYGGAMLDEKEIEAVVAVMRNPNGMVVGRQVRAFEAMCAPLLGKKHGVMVNSGSSALLLALRLLDLPKGAEVITPTLTFSTDVSSIVHAGYVPAFVDVVLDTYQIDIDKIERMITPKTKAMLIPNLVGGLPDWDRLRQLADKHGLKLIEDSCDTLGAKLRGRSPGERVDISVTSFSIFHIITCLGNGGLVAINDEKLWDRALMLRSWGRSSEKFMHGTRMKDSDGRFLEDLDGMDYDGMFIFEELGYGFIPNEAGAAFGQEQIKKLDYFSELRSKVFDRHTKFLSKHEDVFILPRLIDDATTTWICYPLQLRPELGWSRRDLQRYLEDLGIFTRVIFSGNATRQPFLRGVEYRADPEGYPVADQIMRNGVMVPCHPSMSEEDSEYLYAAIDRWVAKQRSR